MAQKRCLECNNKISGKVSFCPHCGCAVSKMTDVPSNSTPSVKLPITQTKPKPTKNKNKLRLFICYLIIAVGLIAIAIIAILGSKYISSGNRNEASISTQLKQGSSLKDGSDITIDAETEIDSCLTDDLPNSEDENNESDSSSDLTLTTESINEQFSTFQKILAFNRRDDIITNFSDSATLDNGNVIVNGYFCNIYGTYEILCWENNAYQINFTWDNPADVDMDDIVDTVNSTLGKFVRTFEYWGIFEWEKHNVKVSVDPEDGVIIGKAYDDGSSDLVIDVATIDRNRYMKLTSGDIDYDIGVINTFMSYLGKPKNLVYEMYPDAVDDDWSQILLAGTMFGVEGRYCIEYNRDTGLIRDVAFDWIPDDRKTHENHFIYCLEKYFGEHQETDQFYFSGITYYQHDWRGTTAENWLVHLSTHEGEGWLQFQQLAPFVPEDDTLPEKRTEANDYDEFIDVVTECFRYIPDCEIYFGTEDTGSSNSYTIKIGSKIVGIFGIELDSYDMVSMIDPDIDNAELYHEQMAISMIMSVDSSLTYEDAKEIFVASKGDFATFGAGIFCFEGMHSGMKAFGIDITWLS